MAAGARYKVVLGVCGSIAAYKTPDLVRRMREQDLEVRVVMTPSAAVFVTPMSLQTVSGYPVRQDLFDPVEEEAMGHIELARWADLVLVAPATASCMARLAHGFADDLLSAICLATESPVWLAPAMNRAMWQNPATRSNRALLLERGVRFAGPGEGIQACGETGEGRMLEPAELARWMRATMTPGKLEGVHALVTAGPTREPLDPVRYLGNRSSGRMGYAMASALAAAGASVELVSGPVSIPPPPCAQLVKVGTALEMEAAVMQRVSRADLFVAAAAVADYRLAEPSPNKIKKADAEMHLRLQRNPDILGRVSALARPPFTLGFAAETERLEEYAEQKRIAKGLDMIAANLVGGTDGGFDAEDNALTVFWAGGRRDFPLMPKRLLASLLVDLLAERYREKNPIENS
jgi:phosphopantothenoylcysteine decarboxylase/phosphopantothenate--cysteine ligase